MVVMWILMGVHCTKLTWCDGDTFNLTKNTLLILKEIG